MASAAPSLRPGARRARILRFCLPWQRSGRSPGAGPIITPTVHGSAGPNGLYGLSQTQRKQYQRCNALQLVGASVPSSAAMVSGAFTQRRYRGGEEDTVFTVSNHSKRPDPFDLLCKLVSLRCSTRWKVDKPQSTASTLARHSTITGSFVPGIGSLQDKLNALLGKLFS